MPIVTRRILGKRSRQDPDTTILLEERLDSRARTVLGEVRNGTLSLAVLETSDGQVHVVEKTTRADADPEFTSALQVTTLEPVPMPRHGNFPRVLAFSGALVAAAVLAGTVGWHELEARRRSGLVQLRSENNRGFRLARIGQFQMEHTLKAVASPAAREHERPLGENADRGAALFSTARRLLKPEPAAIPPIGRAGTWIGALAGLVSNSWEECLERAKSLAAACPPASQMRSQDQAWMQPRQASKRNRDLRLKDHPVRAAEERNSAADQEVPAQVGSTRLRPSNKPGETARPDGSGSSRLPASPHFPSAGKARRAAALASRNAGRTEFLDSVKATPGHRRE